MIARYSEQEPATLGEMTGHFRALYMVPKTDLRADYAHTVLHAMTGCGIDMRGEECVDVYMWLAVDGVFPDHEKIRILHEVQLKFLGGRPVPGYPAQHSELESQLWRATQIPMPVMSQAEMRAHCDVALQMSKTFYRAAGFSLSVARPADFANIPFAAVDFTTQVFAVREAYRTDAERLLETRASRAFNSRSLELRGQPMPQALSPWCGPQKLYY